MLLKFSEDEHKKNFRACQPYIIFTHTHNYCVKLVLLIGQHSLEHEVKTEKNKGWMQCKTTAIWIIVCLKNNVLVNKAYRNCQVCQSGWLAISISFGPNFQLQIHHTNFDKIRYDMTLKATPNSNLCPLCGN